MQNSWCRVFCKESEHTDTHTHTNNLETLKYFSGSSFEPKDMIRYWVKNNFGSFSSSKLNSLQTSMRVTQWSYLRVLPLFPCNTRCFSDKAKGCYYTVTFNAEAICDCWSLRLPQASRMHQFFEWDQFVDCQDNGEISSRPSTINSRGN